LAYFISTMDNVELLQSTVSTGTCSPCHPTVWHLSDGNCCSKLPQRQPVGQRSRPPASGVRSGRAQASSAAPATQARARRRTATAAGRDGRRGQASITGCQANTNRSAGRPSQATCSLPPSIQQPLRLPMSNEPRVARPSRLARPVQVCRAADGLTSSLAPSLCCRSHPDQSALTSGPSPPSATEFLVGVRVGTVRLGPVGERFRPYHIDQKRAEHAISPARAAGPSSRRPIPQQHETLNP
jgi:hypothetical protein